MTWRNLPVRFPRHFCCRPAGVSHLLQDHHDHEHDLGLAHDLQVINALSSRRRALRWFAGAGAGALLSACDGGSAAGDTGTVVTPTPSPGASVTPTPSPTSTPTPTAGCVVDPTE